MTARARGRAAASLARCRMYRKTGGCRFAPIFDSPQLHRGVRFEAYPILSYPIPSFAIHQAMCASFAAAFALLLIPLHAAKLAATRPLPLIAPCCTVLRALVGGAPASPAPWSGLGLPWAGAVPALGLGALCTLSSFAQHTATSIDATVIWAADNYLGCVFLH